MIHQMFAPNDPFSKVLRLNISKPLFQYSISHLVLNFHNLINVDILVFIFHTTLRMCVNSSILITYFKPEEPQDL